MKRAIWVPLRCICDVIRALKHTNSRQFGSIHEHVIRHIICEEERRRMLKSTPSAKPHYSSYKSAPEYYRGFCQCAAWNHIYIHARDIYIYSTWKRRIYSNPAFIWLDKRYSCCMLGGRRWWIFALSARLICSSSNAQKLSRRAFVELLRRTNPCQRNAGAREFARWNNKQTSQGLRSRHDKYEL